MKRYASKPTIFPKSSLKPNSAKISPKMVFVVMEKSADSHMDITTWKDIKTTKVVTTVPRSANHSGSWANALMDQGASFPIAKTKKTNNFYWFAVKCYASQKLMLRVAVCSPYSGECIYDSCIPFFFFHSNSKENQTFSKNKLSLRQWKFKLKPVFNLMNH